MKIKPKKTMRLETVAYSRMRKSIYWADIAGFIQASCISFMLTIVGNWCWVDSWDLFLQPFAIPFWLTATAVYFAEWAKYYQRIAIAKYEYEERERARYEQQRHEEYQQQQQEIEDSKQTTEYLKDCFFVAQSLWEKDAYLWILLLISNYHMLFNPPTGLTHTDRVGGIHFLKRHHIFDAFEALSATQWAENLTQSPHLKEQEGMPWDHLALLRDALVGTDIALSRQEYLYKIAILAGIQIENAPPRMSTMDCEAVIKWLDTQGYLSNESIEKLTQWANNQL